MHRRAYAGARPQHPRKPNPDAKTRGAPTAAASGQFNKAAKGVHHERFGERVDHDFIAIPARSAKKDRAELRLDTYQVACLRWPAEGMVVLDADTVEYTGKNGKTYHRLVDWEVAGVRGRSAKILRAEDLPVVNDNNAE